MRDILTEIAAYKRDFVARARSLRPLEEARAAASDTAPPADFAAALRAPGISLIAEIKKASPSRGVIRADFDPEALARAYAGAGARALSVLTDEAYFQGRDAYLQIARRASGLPALRKDFTVDPYQIYESRLIGADAVLLIVALMDGGQLEDFVGLSGQLGLAALVEVHTAVELERAAGAGAALIGVNNRDLRTFETSLETTFALLPAMPAGAVKVSESGIRCRDDVGRLAAAGVDAILVGESLMREADVGAKVRELLGQGVEPQGER
ncbi:MAG: indole-3-glycerol phosphate synthase TrpC [Gemmatimonadota bacterium]